MAVQHRHSTIESTRAAEREPAAIDVASIRAGLGISRERFARVMDVSSRTVQRWEEGGSLPTNRWVLRVLVQLQEIVDLGLRVWTPRGLHLVMTTPQPGFDGRSGLELVEEGQAEGVIGMAAGLYEPGVV